MSDSIEQVVDDIRRGRMVIVVDDGEAATHGRLVMAADAVRPEDVNFMARYGRGLVSLAVTHERCERLGLSLMAHDSSGTDQERFTVSIEAARGVSTGISAADRATTIRAAVAPDARPHDVVQPGHVFPLLALPGGVLNRAGHTEAGCDLARLAGRDPSAVTVEILDDNGALADRDALGRLASEHGLRIAGIAALIEHRLQHEKTVRRVADSPLPTEFGEFRLAVYEDTVGGEVHMALVRGPIDPRQPVLVRVHLENPLYDLTASTRHDGGWPLRDVLERIGREGGVVVILRNKIERSELVAQVQRWSQSDVEHREPRKPGLRVIGIGAQILADLGVRRMRVLSLPRRFLGISGFGLEVVEHVTSGQ